MQNNPPEPNNNQNPTEPVRQGIFSQDPSQVGPTEPTKQAIFSQEPTPASPDQPNEYINEQDVQNQFAPNQPDQYDDGYDQGPYDPNQPYDDQYYDDQDSYDPNQPYDDGQYYDDQGPYDPNQPYDDGQYYDDQGPYDPNQPERPYQQSPNILDQISELDVDQVKARWKGTSKGVKIAIIATLSCILVYIIIRVVLQLLVANTFSQANQETARRQDYRTVVEKVTRYLTENNGKLPPDGSHDASEFIDSNAKDPSGTAYKITVIDCSQESTCPSTPEVSIGEIIIAKSARCSSDGPVDNEYPSKIKSDSSSRSFVVWGYSASDKTKAYCFSSQ